MKFNCGSKSFGSVCILEPFMLELPPHTITILSGPSGVGKSTLLRLLAGLERDDQGRIHQQGTIGMMFQEPRLLPWKTVSENIEIAGAEAGLIEALGLGDARLAYPHQLSLGMARRVAFARALVSQPDLLILDEPFASLDEALVMRLISIISDINHRRPCPIILTSHDHRHAAALNARKLSLHGKPAKLLSVRA